MSSELHAIYRISPARKSEVRPEWFSQRACVRSFIAAAETARSAGISLRSTVIIDGDLDANLLSELDWFDQREHVRLLGNSPAFRYALGVALSSAEELTLFAEDDYMWTSTAIVSTVRLFSSEPTAKYASPYAHPVIGDTSRREVRRHRSFTTSVNDLEWISTPSTTMTFACRSASLHADYHYWWLASYGKSPKDGYAFAALTGGRWFTLVGNAAFRDPRRVLNRKTVQLISLCTARRLRPARRPLLLQPAESLATHVHEPFITGATDWSGLADSMDQSSR